MRSLLPFLTLDCRTKQKLSRSLLAAAFLCVVFTIRIFSSETSVDSAAEDLSNAAKHRMITTLNYLASDDLKGRAIGSSEIDLAANFIVEQFKRIGLQTNVFEQSAFQEFEIPGKLEVSDEEKNQLAIQPPGDENSESTTGSAIKLTLNSQFRPLAIGGSATFDCPLVFAGYGITAPELSYDDYRSVDVRGKAVILLRKEPQQNDEKSKFNGSKPSKHAFFATKVQNAIQHGAAVVILVNDSAEYERALSRHTSNWQRHWKRLSKLQDDAPLPENDEFPKFRKRVEKLAAQIIEAGERIDRADPLLAVTGAGTSPIDDEVPVLFCQRSVVDSMLQSATGQRLKEFEVQIDASLKPASTELDGWRVRGVTRLERKKVRAKNIVAVLPGEGDLADETVVIGAHYDHVGMGGAGSLAPWTTAVHNGADDNASGVTALLEIARRLSQSNEPRRRRVVFIAFSAEETGLLGSRYYVDHPRFPLQNTVAMLNLDMVGRLHDKPLQVHGVGSSNELEQIADEIAKHQGLAIRKVESGNGPSDHASFYAKQIPVLHFFTGLHADYHRPSDDVDKIDVGGLEEIASFVTEIAGRLIRNDQRIHYQSPKTKERPRLGIQIDVDSDGCRIQHVVKGSAANRVGLVAGDVVVAADGTRVRSRDDLLKVLSTKESGDVIEITVLHEKAEQTFKVKLGNPR